MYASDLTHKKRAAAVFRNLQLQKDWFASGGTIRILGQKGGNDYAYMNEIQEGCVADKCWQYTTPLGSSSGNGEISGNTSGMTSVNFTGIIDNGSVRITNILDDAAIPLSMGGMNFYFFGINHGIANNISWYSNNAIIFGLRSIPRFVSLSGNTCPAILLGNYDRLCSGVSYNTYDVQGGVYTVTKLVVSFADYYTNTTNLTAGGLQIRFIRENTGSQRQWIEVGVISSVASPGYSNNSSITYPSGRNPSGNPVDSDGNTIDTTKNSPWDVTDGTRFLNIVGSIYSTAFPATGTTMLYQSDSTGYNWQFSNNAFMNI